MKNIGFALTVILSSYLVRAQETTYSITVLGYQWTTSHKTITFSWPGSANTSCNGNTNVNGYISTTGNISANGTSSSTCSSTYTPPTSQNIDIQKPVVFILAETVDTRMVLTCTRNVRWSQCHALNPGPFAARNDNGHFEVQALSGKGKEEWIKFDIVQQAALTRQQPQESSAREALPSIEAPTSETPGTNAGFPSRWKSMTNGSVRTLRFQGDYIYGEVILPEARSKAGAFFLMDVKKDGDKYIGKINARIVSQGGKSCSSNWPVELTMVTPERIEGRTLKPPDNSKVDWSACTFSPAADWQAFTWIPVQ